MSAGHISVPLRSNAFPILDALGVYAETFPEGYTRIGPAAAPAGPAGCQPGRGEGEKGAFTPTSVPCNAVLWGVFINLIFTFTVYNNTFTFTINNCFRNTKGAGK